MKEGKEIGRGEGLKEGEKGGTIKTSGKNPKYGIYRVAIGQ